MGEAEEPPGYYADPLFTELPQQKKQTPAYYAEPLFTELPHQGDRTPTWPEEELFYELPKPSQTVSALCSVTDAPPDMPLRQRVAGYSGETWEEFVWEWAESLEKEGYVTVNGLGGSYDHGADVAAFLTSRKTDGPWHCYQAKCYEKAITPAVAYPEMFKIIWAVAVGKYSVFPERYWFVAPKVGLALKQILARPDQLKAAFLVWVAENAPKLTRQYGDSALQRTIVLAQSLHFSCFDAPETEKVLEQHAKSRYHAARFRRPLPDRPPAEETPQDIGEHETPYVQKMQDVYEERYGPSVSTLEQVEKNPEAKANLQNQREAFYRAEQLRTFCRDSVPPGTFAWVQKAVYSGVKEVEEDDHETGWARLKAVVNTAQIMHLGSNQLIDKVEPDDRKGICHQLANDGKLTWVRKDVPWNR